jgi:hypothetical protein
LHPTKCVCGNKLPSRKLGRPQKFCCNNCRKAHSKWNVRTYGPQRRRNVPKSLAKSDNSRPDFGDLPLSILGPRFSWEGKPIDPRVLEAIRYKEMGPIPSAVTTKNLPPKPKLESPPFSRFQIGSHSPGVSCRECAGAGGPSGRVPGSYTPLKRPLRQPS